MFAIHVINMPVITSVRESLFSMILVWAGERGEGLRCWKADLDVTYLFYFFSEDKKKKKERKRKEKAFFCFSSKSAIASALPGV